MKRSIVFVGEAMLEERVNADGKVLRHYGGDTLNSAIHMVRLGSKVAFASALGPDSESAMLRRRWASEGMDSSLLLDHPHRKVGRYAIALDQAGERTFSYDRAESAARALFEYADDGWKEAVGQADLLAFSLISLAVLPEGDRGKLLDLARRVRANGGRVAFDGNYRPPLWEDADHARRWGDAAIAEADFGLPTLDDEIALGGVANARDVASHWKALGCREVVVKQGEAGCLLPGGERVAPAEVLRPVDTSGAGDAFNAGYLAARLDGSDCATSAALGHRVAGWTIMRHGAIPPRDADYPIIG